MSFVFEQRSTISLLFQESLGLLPSWPTVFSFSFQTTRVSAVFSADFSSRCYSPLFSTLIKCHKSQKSLFLSIFLSSTHFITDPDLMFLKSHHSFCNVKQPKLQARETIGLVYAPATFFMFFFRTILVIYPDRVNFHYLSVQQIDKET